MRFKKITTRAVIILWLAALIILIISAVWSGYRFSYNSDELMHAQIAYLLHIGDTPFRDYFSEYSPLFHWFITPAFILFGMTIRTIHMLRIDMILLFGIEVGCTIFFLQSIYGSLVAAVFVGLLFLDPFTTFSGMQIRPDTLMLTFFAAGLASAAAAIKSHGRWRWLITGIFLSLSTLTSIKIFPAVTPVVIALLIVLARSGRKKSGIWHIVGLVVPWFIFIGYFGLIGVFKPMLTELTIDLKYMQDAFQYPTYFGFFHQPGNDLFFGLPGRPLTWVYIWILPLFAGAGAFPQLTQVLKGEAKNGESSAFNFFKAGLVMSMVLSYLALFTLSNVFVQYYVLTYYLFAVFAAVAFANIWQSIRPAYRFWPLIIAVIIYFCIANTAIRANFTRATMSFDQTDQNIMHRWEQMPKGSIVFPGYLFRPIAYPITGHNMGDIPPVIRSQFMLPEVYIARDKVPYVYLTIEAFGQFELSTQHYIQAHYIQTKSDPDLWIRKL